MTTCLPKESSCPQSEAAADQAVRKVFAVLGVDFDDPESLENFRRDLRVAGTIRKAVDRGVMVAAAAIAAGICAAVWASITSHMTRTG
jgi:hypothetical protein